MEIASRSGFAGEIGDEVTAMTGGAVIKVDEDKLYGKR